MGSSLCGSQCAYNCMGVCACTRARLGPVGVAAGCGDPEASVHPSHPACALLLRLHSAPRHPAPSDGSLRVTCSCD